MIDIKTKNMRKQELQARATITIDGANVPVWRLSELGSIDAQLMIMVMASHAAPEIDSLGICSIEDLAAQMMSGKELGLSDVIFLIDENKTRKNDIAIVAFVHVFRRMSGSKKRECQRLERLLVMPEFRRRGVAGALTRLVVNEALAAGEHVSVACDKSLAKLYRGNGFSGHTRRASDCQSAVCMSTARNMDKYQHPIPMADPALLGLLSAMLKSWQSTIIEKPEGIK